MRSFCKVVDFHSPILASLEAYFYSYKVPTLVLTFSNCVSLISLTFEFVVLVLNRLQVPLF